MMPSEPVLNPETGIKQHSFLVEMRSLPGYSGSPVFVYSPNVNVEVEVDAGYDYTDATAELEPIHRIFLLGIDWCHIKTNEKVRDLLGLEQGSLYVPQNTGMAGVVPAWKLGEILTSND